MMSRSASCGVVFVLSLSAPRALAQSDAHLFPGREYAVGASPQSIAVADVNGDGAPDAVTANQQANTVSVLIGDSAGGFAPHFDCDTGNHPTAIAIGDVNLDGHADIVCANGSGTVSVLLGDGLGHFGAHVDFAAGVGPSFVAIGDLNADGKPDLVVACFNANTISVLLGDGHGAFGTAASFSTGFRPSCVVLRDLNGDGKLDAVVSDSNASPTEAGISVLLGNGQGGFGARTDFSGMDHPQAIATADLNGDGKLDLAVACPGSSSVALLFGDGHGVFTLSPTILPTNLFPSDIAIADLDGDGKLDIATANYGEDTVSVMLGNGLGNFGARQDFTGGGGSLAVADLNGDGVPDLAVANFTCNAISVLLGTGAAHFHTATVLHSLGSPGAMATGDLNGDGRLDLAAANGNSVSVLLGGAQGFGQHMEYPAGTNAVSVAIGDLNGDGKPDLVVVNQDSNNVSVMLGVGDGTFPAHSEFAVGSSPSSVAIGDLNGDGSLDLVVANHGANTVSILMGDGSGAFGAASTMAVETFPRFVRLADLNHDGRLDLVVVVLDSSVRAYLGDGHGAFGAPIPFSFFHPTCAAIGDVNGDGHPDIVATTNDSIAVSLGNGLGGFSAPTRYVVTYPLWVELGDVNGDGAADVVVEHGGANKVSVLLGNGLGTLSDAIGFDVITPHDYDDLVVADVNGDGRPEIVMSDSITGTISILSNLGNGSPFFALCSAAFADPHACPCSNTGLPGRGCDNSIATGGAALSATGGASLSNDTVHIRSSDELPSALSIVLQGTIAITPASFGDGVRCTGGTLEHLYAKHASAGSITVPGAGDAPISTRSAALGDAIATGATRVYQVFYRDGNLAFCPGGFNATSAIAIAWGS